MAFLQAFETKRYGTNKIRSHRSRQSGPAKSSTGKRAKSATNRNGSMLEDYFVDTLKDIYRAEKALTKALPRMAKAATSRELRKAFEQHLATTKNQVGRVEKIFQLMGKRQAKKCEAMQGPIEESENIVGETKNDVHPRRSADHIGPKN